VSFAAHVRNMTQYLAIEKLRRRLYTKYETLMMTLETLQARFRAPMKHNAGLLFESSHDHTDNILFKFAMSNLATTLTSWAKDMNLEPPPWD
jgi:predicted nucleic acid-binding protein